MHRAQSVSSIIRTELQTFDQPSVGKHKKPANKKAQIEATEAIYIPSPQGRENNPATQDQKTKNNHTTETKNDLKEST